MDAASRVRIGMLVYGLDRPPTGVGRYSIELMTALRELGLIATLLGNQAGYLPKREAYPIVHLPGCKLLPGLMTVGNFVIPRAADRADLQLVHDPTGNAPFLFGAGPARTLVTVHDLLALAFPHTSTLLEKIITRIWLPMALPGVDAIIANSRCTKEDILRFTKVPAEKIHVVPMGQQGFARVASPIVNSTLERLGLKSGYLLTVSSFEPRRNLLRLLDAYARLRAQGEKRQLVMVGRARMGNDVLLQRIEELGLQGQIVFTGYVSRDDLPTLYSGADLFIFPSLYEGFGIPLLEAMACGTPVVTSNLSALPEVVGEAAVLVDPYDVASIETGMLQALHDTGLRVELMERGPQRAAEFSWERTARETLAIYRSVVN